MSIVPSTPPRHRWRIPRPNLDAFSAALGMLLLVLIGLLVLRSAGAASVPLTQNAFLGSEVATDTPAATVTPAPTLTPAATDTPAPTPTPAPVSTVTFGCLSVTPQVPANGTYALRTCISTSPALTSNDIVEWQIQFCPGTPQQVTIGVGSRLDDNGVALPASPNDPDFSGSFTASCTEPFNVVLTALSTNPNVGPQVQRPLAGSATVTVP